MLSGRFITNDAFLAMQTPLKHVTHKYGLPGENTLDCQIILSIITFMHGQNIKIYLKNQILSKIITWYYFLTQFSFTKWNCLLVSNITISTSTNRYFITLHQAALFTVWYSVAFVIRIGMQCVQRAFSLARRNLYTISIVFLLSDAWAAWKVVVRRTLCA